jgi:hypothetical protein
MTNHTSLEKTDRVCLRRTPNPDTADAAIDPTLHPLHTLGRQLGNAQVARMLAQREDAPEEEEEQVQAKHDIAQREGAPEEEEEQIAAKHDLAQRESDAAPQPEVGLEGGPVSDALAGRINGRRGAGASLDGGTRATMEGSFGTSFEDVRVHTDAESDALNRSISAKAFTTGSDIFFRNDTSPGDHGLLAHELTHVVQQRAGAGSGGGMTVGPAGDSHEQAADATSTAVTSGAAAQAQREADEAQRTAVQRENAAPEEEEQAAG